MNIIKRVAVAISFLVFLLLYSYHVVDSHGTVQHQPPTKNIITSETSAEMFEIKSAGASAHIQ